MDKGLERRRLFIYLAFAFSLTWLVFFAYIFSGNVWAADGGISGMDQLVSLGMLCPALAMLLTRYVTREGFAVTGEDSMLLGIHFQDRKWIYFVVAAFLPWIYLELGNIFTLLFSPGAFDVHNPDKLGMTGDQQALIYIQPIIMIVTGVTVSFAALGEEAGWRGYMMPKMIKLWGVRKAVIIGGIIWGMWHWPLTFVGHNFGTDYWGYPFTGFAGMCVSCVFMGMLLTVVTYQSESIWPAVFLHAVNNASPSVLQYFINTDKITGWRSDSMAAFVINSIPMVLIAVFVFMKWSKPSTAKKAENLC